MLRCKAIDKAVASGVAESSKHLIVHCLAQSQIVLANFQRRELGGEIFG